MPCSLAAVGAVALGLMSLPFHTLRPDATWFTAATAAPLACGACLIATAAYITLDDPGDGDGGLTVCPYRAATGLWCPGCGLTRATHHLANGNVLQALSLNLLAPLLLAGLMLAWWTWFMVAVGQGVPRSIGRLGRGPYALLAMIILAFTVARNLPDLEILRGG